ncbi:type II secretion system F family protein [Nocardioides taihuensis]|uniref:Type II secretion system F family protein n=1 Tax=Nocardioides taihuensis TaxID=1835606 RepID=A0ABW0BPT1_9ACTN
MTRTSGTRRGVLRPGRAIVAAAAVVLLAGAPATATPEAGDAAITHVEPDAAGVQILVSVPADAEVDLEGVTVEIDGQDATATAALASTTDVQRTAVLTIDTSNSMKGERFAAAKQAALTFLDTVPDDVYVGIVTFDSTVEDALEPTLDRDAARTVVQGLELGPETALYDGIVDATALAGEDGQRSLLVLSDGADNNSKATLDDATKAVEDAEVLVDVVSLGQTGEDLAALEDVADAGQGQVIDADPAALKAAFSAEADVLARQVLVTAQVPDSVTAEEATVLVSLPSDTGPVSASAFSTIKAAPAEEVPAEQFVIPAADSGGFVLPTAAMYGGLVAIGIGLLALLIVFVPRKQGPLTAEETAATYTARTSGKRSAKRAKVEPDAALAGAKDAAAAVLAANQGFEAKVAARLEQAGSPFKPAEWLLIHTGIFIGAGAVGLLLGGGGLFLGLVFLALGAIIPWFWLGWKKNRRRKSFDGSLPNTLQLISGSLAAGLSLAQSVDTVVREGQEPIASEFRRALVETRLGVGLEDALEAVGQRFDSKDFAWVVMAIRIQRQVGGNLAELLDSVAETMREREYMRRQVAALAAEGKLSAWVLGGLPLIFLVYLYLSNREYVMPLFTEPIGWMMLLGGAVLLSVGIFWMSRLVKVEV